MSLSLIKHHTLKTYREYMIVCEVAMTNGRVAKTIYKWKPYATRPKGRPRLRWEDDVRNDLRKMGVSNWKLFFFFFFSSTTLCEYWLVHLFLSISSSPASVIGIRKEDIEKDIWPNTEGKRKVETQKNEELEEVINNEN